MIAQRDWARVPVGGSAHEGQETARPRGHAPIRWWNPAALLAIVALVASAHVANTQLSETAADAEGLKRRRSPTNCPPYH